MRRFLATRSRPTCQQVGLWDRARQKSALSHPLLCVSLFCYCVSHCLRLLASSLALLHCLARCLLPWFFDFVSCVTVSLPLSLYHCLSTTVSLPLSLYHCHSTTVSLPLSLSHSLSLSLSLPPCAAWPHSLRLLYMLFSVDVSAHALLTLQCVAQGKTGEI